MSTTSRSLAAAAMLLAAAGCSGRHAATPAPAASPQPVAKPAWTRLSPAEMTPPQKALQQRCMEAVQTMGKRLLGRLEHALDEGDPAAAVEVCRTQAPAIARAVASEYDLRIGRTSYRLRNPANVPPPWAKGLVERRVEQPTWLAGPGGRLAGLLPIRLKPECGMCHGPQEEIDPKVRTALARWYPEDAATGFHPGDLRGWFWVEAKPAG